MAFEVLRSMPYITDKSRLRSGVPAESLMQAKERLSRAAQGELNRKELYELRLDVAAWGTRCDLWKAIVHSCGERYQSVDLKGFEQPTQAQRTAVEIVRGYIAGLRAAKPTGRNLVFIGPPGTGKDHLMMAVLRCVIHRFGWTSAWVDGQSLFAAVRNSYSNGDNEESLVTFSVRRQLFAISDPLPPNGNLTEHQRNVLFRLIDGRYRNGMPTCATINVASREELDDRLGDSLSDRLCHDAVIVPCFWESYRRKPTNPKRSSGRNAVSPPGASPIGVTALRAEGMQDHTSKRRTVVRPESPIEQRQVKSTLLPIGEHLAPVVTMDRR